MKTKDFKEFCKQNKSFVHTGINYDPLSERTTYHAHGFALDAKNSKVRRFGLCFDPALLTEEQKQEVVEEFGLSKLPETKEEYFEILSLIVLKTIYNKYGACVDPSILKTSPITFPRVTETNS